MKRLFFLLLLLPALALAQDQTIPPRPSSGGGGGGVDSVLLAGGGISITGTNGTNTLAFSGRLTNTLSNQAGAPTEYVTNLFFTSTNSNPPQFSMVSTYMYSQPVSDIGVGLRGSSQGIILRNRNTGQLNLMRGDFTSILDADPTIVTTWGKLGVQTNSVTTTALMSVPGKILVGQGGFTDPSLALGATNTGFSAPGSRLDTVVAGSQVATFNPPTANTSSLLVYGNIGIKYGITLMAENTGIMAARPSSGGTVSGTVSATNRTYARIGSTSATLQSTNSQWVEHGGDDAQGITFLRSMSAGTNSRHLRLSVSNITASAISITPTGVGIGVTNPAYALDVSGSAQVSGNVSAASVSVGGNDVQTMINAIPTTVRFARTSITGSSGWTGSGRLHAQALTGNARLLKYTPGDIASAWSMGSMQAGVDGEVVVILNTTGYAVEIIHEDALEGDAQKRFTFADGLSRYIQDKQSAAFIYDGEDSRWRALGALAP